MHFGRTIYCRFVVFACNYMALTRGRYATYILKGIIIIVVVYTWKMIQLMMINRSMLSCDIVQHVDIENVNNK